MRYDVNTIHTRYGDFFKAKLIICTNTSTAYGSFNIQDELGTNPESTPGLYITVWHV